MDTGNVKTYDAKNVIIIFGTVTLTDFADGDFLSVTFEDFFESVEGADGAENRIAKNKKGANVELTIQQVSLSNDLFSAIHNEDKLLNTGKKPLTVKDLNGTTLLFSPQAYIKKFSDIGNGNSMGTRTWSLRAPNPVVNVGSNL